MMIEEINMRVGDLVVAIEAAFEGDTPLSVGTVGIVKRIEQGGAFNPQVLVHWARYGYQSWEHPDSVKVVSSAKK
jgi:hypothetical protein|tara:strand:+ start:290 stop:514 length:225 start_codon:yes stop_codon:yes gene_type:complete